MSCNCKKKMVLEDNYGVKEKENLISKIKRYSWKCTLFIILMTMCVVLIPVIVVVAFYQIAFAKKAKIALPKFLGKYIV